MLAGEKAAWILTVVKGSTWLQVTLLNTFWKLQEAENGVWAPAKENVVQKEGELRASTQQVEVGGLVEHTESKIFFPELCQVYGNCYKWITGAEDEWGEINRGKQRKVLKEKKEKKRRQILVIVSSVLQNKRAM